MVLGGADRRISAKRTLELTGDLFVPLPTAPCLLQGGHPSVLSIQTIHSRLQNLSVAAGGQ